MCFIIEKLEEITFEFPKNCESSCQMKTQKDYKFVELLKQ